MQPSPQISVFVKLSFKAVLRGFLTIVALGRWCLWGSRCQPMWRISIPTIYPVRDWPYHGCADGHQRIALRSRFEPLAVARPQ